MNLHQKIPVNRFREIYKNFDLKCELSKSGLYEIWHKEGVEDNFTVLPISDEISSYDEYQFKNIIFTTQLLGLEDTEETFDEIKGQLIQYNYKLLNRIVSNNAIFQDAVPYKMAEVLTEKNVSSFLYYYNSRTKTTEKLSVDNFNLNHTQQGSFVIPVSISVDSVGIFGVQTRLNALLREYLEVIDFISRLDASTAESFAKQLLEYKIDSRIAKEFFAPSGLAKYKNEYKEKLSDITISGRGNPILDNHLDNKLKVFKEISLENISVVEDSYIKLLEKMEFEQNIESINEKGVTIEAIVDGLDRDGRVKFTVLSINSTKLEKVFKAYVDEQPEGRLLEFADSFKSAAPLLIHGDIRKAKSQSGKMLIQTVSKNSDQQTLF